MSNRIRDDELIDGSDDGFDFDEATVELIESLAVGSDELAVATKEFDSSTLFEMLVDPGRRYVLTYLLRTEGAVACSELVDYVVDQTEHTMTTGEFRQRVTAELTQEHLPKLDEYGYVQYNMERQIIGPTELTPLVRPYLELALAYQQIAEVNDESS